MEYLSKKTLDDLSGKPATHYATTPNMVAKIMAKKKKKSLNEYYNPNKTSLEFDNSNLDPVCKICMANIIDVICFPCKHAWICNECYVEYKLKRNVCELCKTKIEYIVNFNMC